jgi:hypothetical protein
VSQEDTPFAKHDFLQQQDGDIFVQETNSPSFQQLSQEMKKREHCIISHTRQAEKVIVVKGKSGRTRMQSSLPKKTEPLGPISWTFETLSAGKGREEEEEEEEEY